MLIWRVLRVLAGYPLLPVDQVRRYLGASTEGLEYTLTALEAVDLIKQRYLGGERFAWLTVRGERFGEHYLSGVSGIFHGTWRSARARRAEKSASWGPFAIEVELSRKSPSALLQKVREHCSRYDVSV